MAQLKDTLITGNLRVTDDILTDTLQTDSIKAHSSSNASDYTTGTNGQVLKTNGTDVYWASDNNSDTKVTQTATSTDANYEVLFSTTADNTTRTETARKNSNLTFNPSTGNLQATTFNDIDIATVVNGVEITWSALKSLCDNSQLVPGRQYRITDYNTTTSLINVQVAGHQFDIIVIADDDHTLNENARACLHEDDTYFANSKLEVWKLKYCLNNDTTRFAWADTTNGKGVIYYMQDEWNNECPYDFKNIQFYKPVSLKCHIEGMYGGGTYYREFYRDESKDISSNQYHVYAWLTDTGSETVYSFSETPSVNYRLISDVVVNGNTIQSGQSNYYVDSISEAKPIRYTFSTSATENSCDDASLIKSRNCYNNTIKPYISTTQKLNNIIFVSTSGSLGAFDNKFEENCYDSLVKLGCKGNTIEENCRNITLGYYNSYNKIEKSCNNITFDDTTIDPYISLKRQNCIVETGNQNIILTGSYTEVPILGQSYVFRNITIAQGVNNGSSTITITHDTVNDDFRTTVEKDSNGVIHQFRIIDKYDKPVNGIPKTDLSSDVQNSLNKADTVFQDISDKADKSDIEQNEFIVSMALNDLNSRIGNAEELLSQI